MAIWRIFRRSPLSEEKYPNRNPAWKQALLIIDFQGNTRKGSSTSLSVAQLINQAGVEGVRLYFARTEGNLTLVVVGTDDENQDLTEGLILDYASICPHYCPPSSPLIA